MEYQIKEQISDSLQSVYVYNDCEKSIPLNSLYSPEKEAIRYLKKIKHLERHVLIIIGFGNGSLLDEIIKSDLFKKNIHFLFIEPFLEVNISDKHLNVIQSNPKLSYYRNDDLKPIYIANFISRFISIPCSIQIHPNYLNANPKQIRKCLNIIEEGIKTKQISNNTELKFATDWIIEPLLNTNYFSKSINLKKLKGTFKGKPAMLIASGPSLKEHLNFIKDKQESFYLFAVGSALRALIKNGIYPDFVLSVDASNRNFETHFQGISFNGPLIYETMSNSKIQEQHQGSLIVSRSSSDFVSVQFFDDLYSFGHSSPSVAVYTMQVIAYLGFSEVYLVGQDLALINGNYYAEGIKHHAGMKDLEAEMLVENNLGETIGTTRALKIFIDSFESLIKTLPKTFKVFNLSMYGARIEGAKYIAANEISKYPKNKVRFNQETIISNIHEGFIEEFIGNLNRLKNEVNLASKDLNNLIKIGGISTVDMLKVVKKFRKVTKHKLLEEVILSQLTFMFDAIINKLAYLEEKYTYTSDDLLEIVNDLNGFYKLILKFIEEIVSDKRLNQYK